MNAPRRVMPHAERLQLFEEVVTFGIMLVIIFCLSVYVVSLPVKAMLMLMTACLFLNRGKTFSFGVWPLLAIPLYGAVVSWVFPCWRPDLWTILERPLFTVLCVLMVSVVLSQAWSWRHRFLAFGILFVCLIGAVGDSLGYDMTAMLPFTMPDDAYFDQVTQYKFGAARVRGFFPESGVLGAVSLGIATCLALGAWVQISQRRNSGGVGVLLASILIGGTMLGLTLTKSGLFMVAAGLAGFLVLLAIGRNRACRMTSVLGAVVAIVLLAALLAAPGDLGGYFRAEVGSALNLQAQTGDAGGSGLATRVECWKLALYSVEYYPLGVGGWGLDNVLNRTTEVVPTPEMRFFFDRDMFGLKSGLANLFAQTGIIGISLLGLWLWGSFLSPALRHLKSGTSTETLLAGLYGASAGLSVVFLFSCELYPSYALLLFFKLQADGMAERVQLPWPEVVEDSVEHLPIMEEATI
jgi:hypothetical protein